MSIRQLEERIAHGERMLELLNEVVVGQEKRLQKLEMQNFQIVEEIRRLRNLLREPFIPEIEKPPQY